MDDFLQRLAPRPSDYGGLPGKITREDDAGNVYDETGRRIFNKFDQTEQPDSWLDTAISTATAPAKLATALVGSLNPYGQDGWQVPPIISEPAAAFARSGESTGFGDDGQFYLPNVQNPQVAQDTLTQLMTVYGGNALNPLARAPAGSVGMFAGRRAKTADLNALAKAEELASSGASRDAIWNETGWFQGPDKQWRFEIDDSQANMRQSMGDVVQASSEPPPFSSVFRHDDLVSAYPDAAEVLFLANQGYKPGTGAMGRFSDPSPYAGRDVFVAGYNASNVGASDIGAVRLMPHEMQHFIQSKEGFAKGGSPSDITSSEIALERARQASATSANNNGWGAVDTYNPDNPDSFFAHQFYNRLAGEVEARNAQKRHDMTPDQRRASPPWTTQDIPDEDQIVRLLSDNRPSIMGSALASQADSLPMDQASRLQRARGIVIDKLDGEYAAMSPDGDMMGNFIYEETPQAAFVLDASVKPEYRRQGVASTVYGAIQDDLGKPLTPDVKLTDDGYSFWKANYPEAVREHIYKDGYWVDPMGYIPDEVPGWRLAGGPNRPEGVLWSDNKPSLLGSALASGQGEEDLLTLLGYR